ncbi:MAG: transposase [Acidimicrobiaceae bacterium]|nr:transposase [Acidimicrobiaceae bacterium]
MTDDDLSASPASGTAGEAALREWAELLVEFARVEGVESRGGGLLTALVQCVPQTGLGAEMAEHLGYERHAAAGRGSGNSRDGPSPKTITAEIGRVGLRARSRAGAFEPVPVAEAPPPSRQLVG